MVQPQTATALLKRELDAVDGILDVVHQHETGTLCKASQSERWEQPRHDNPYFDDKKQIRRTRAYERRLQRVFRDLKTRFNAAYREHQPSVFRSLLSFLTPPNRRQELNPLGKADSITEWEEIVAISTAELEDELHRALMLNVSDELSHVITEVGSNVIRIHALKATLEGIFIPEDTLAFFDAYELRLSQRTLSRVDGRLKDIIRDGLAQGWSNQRIRDKITTHFDQLTGREAFMIARTETIRASAEGSKIAYVAVGIQKVDVLPALDACPICIDIASRNPYAVTDTRAYAPFHPNCRCAIVPVVGGRSVFDPTKYPPVFTTDSGNPTFTER